MLKTYIKITFVGISLVALALSGCGATITTAAQATAEFQTAVAETVAARATDTPLPTSTPTFTPTITPTATVTDTPTVTPITPTSVTNNYCDNSAFVADVSIPDHTILAAGQVFEKTWTFKNTGTCTWTPGYTIVFMSGDMMKGVTRQINQTVSPNETVNVTVRLTAPFTPREYTGVWRLANSKGQPFGEFVSVVINVAGPGTTVPTLEANPAVTPTPTP